MKVIKIKEHKDGSATMTYELGITDFEFFKELAKKKKKKFDKTCINKQVLTILKEKCKRGTK